MKNKTNNNKLLLIFGMVLLIIVAIVTAVIVIKNSNGEQVNNGENIVNENMNVSGKLAEYLKSLTNNYYIKYSGKFKNSSGDMVSGIVEYTKKGENFALKANELDIQIICENDKLYSISHVYKMIVEMSKQSFDISSYNLVSDIGQTFVKSYKERINNTEYDVEEYSINNKIIKYHFKGNDIKLINYNSQDIRIIRVEKNTNNELFVKPQGYVNV